jgi:hypothetical protein
MPIGMKVTVDAEALEVVVPIIERIAVDVVDRSDRPTAAKANAVACPGSGSRLLPGPDTAGG